MIVPTVRLSFLIVVPLLSVIESDSLSIRTGTNRQGKELFVMAVRSASGDTLPGFVSWSNARIDLFLWSVLSSATDMERDGNEQPHTCEIVL